jgi:hypothetical protein
MLALKDGSGDRRIEAAQDGIGSRYRARLRQASEHRTRKVDSAFGIDPMLSF